MNVNYCPVVAIMVWLKMLRASGINSGPLFPFCPAGHKTLMKGELAKRECALCLLVSLGVFA
jgi:hypothetical protein